MIGDHNPVFFCGLASVLHTEGDFRLALLDVSLSDPEGLPVLAKVRTEALLTRVVFLSSLAVDAARAFSMGASGVLPKDGTPQSLVRWLRQIMSGQQRVPFAARNTHMRGEPEEPVIAPNACER